MRVRQILKLIICLFSISIIGISSQQKELSFEDFPVKRVFRNKPIQPDVTRGQARSFRTEIQRQARSGPNFAGNYTFVNWGCGTCCSQFAIVDAISGRVYFPGFNVTCTNTSQGMGHDFQYRINSDLLIMMGSRNGKGGGKYYYRWRNNRLNFIRTAKY
jgi:hypothetical protein